MRPTPRHPEDEALVDAFVNHTVHVAGRSRDTGVRHRANLRRFLHWCRQHHLDGSGLSVSQVTAFLDAEVARGLQPSAVAAVQSTLRAFYAYLRPDGPNPARATPLPDTGPSTLRPYQPDEAERILAPMRHASDPGQRFDLAVVATFAGTGVRRGELLRLRTDDLDLRVGVLLVRNGPTGDRTVPLPPALAELLGGYRAEVRPLCPPSDRLFANPRASFDSPLHGRLEPTVAGDIVRRAGRRSGVDGPHTCPRWRATAAVDLLRAGVDLAEVQRRLGHADPATTAGYLRMVGADAVADPSITW